MVSVASQFEYNVSRSKYFRAISTLPNAAPSSHPVRYIAYYLPQFHAIRENDEWWGPGFTEWTNVTKALPQYQGHYQPRLPGDLGFYDLSNVEHIRRQVDLANRSGIYGFCIHNYWFSGRRLLETPVRVILNNKDINIRFCLNWANENWSRRWDGSENEILIQQNYAPDEDIQYAEYLCEFIEDDRYIKINGRPLIMVYRPGFMPNPRATVERWREFFVKRGYGNPYIIMPQAFKTGMPEDYGADDPRAFGMDAAAGFPPHKVGWGSRNIRPLLRPFDPKYCGRIFSYDEMMTRAVNNVPKEFLLFPGVCPQWDNEARRPKRGSNFVGSTPQKYGKWLLAASQQALRAPTEDERIVFINAWNEWAEGAYLEPDQHFGCAYLFETLSVFRNFLTGQSNPYAEVKSSMAAPFEIVHASYINFIRNFPTLGARRIFRTLGLKGNSDPY